MRYLNATEPTRPPSSANRSSHPAHGFARAESPDAAPPVKGRGTTLAVENAKGEHHDSISTGDRFDDPVEHRRGV